MPPPFFEEGGRPDRSVALSRVQTFSLGVRHFLPRGAKRRLRRGRLAARHPAGCLKISVRSFHVRVRHLFISRRAAPPMGRADRPATSRSLGTLSSNFLPRGAPKYNCVCSRDIEHVHNNPNR